MKKFILAVPLIIVISVVTAIVLLLLGSWIWGMAVLSFSLILNLWSETFALHPFMKKEKDYAFRVLTYNLNRAHEFSVNKGTTEGLIDIILQQKADLVLLQEYNADLYPDIQERLSCEYPYESGIEKNSRFKSVFSRFPIESCEQLMIDAHDHMYELFQNSIYSKKKFGDKEVLPICKITIKEGERTLQIFNCHLMSNNYSVVIRNLRKKGRSIVHGVLPILHRMDFGYQARKLQSQILSLHIDKLHPTLICGDFNDICGSSPLSVFFKQGFSDAWWKGGFGFGFTFHGMGLRLRLDHVLYSDKTLKLVNVSVPHSDASDHYPVVCDFKFI